MGNRKAIRIAANQDHGIRELFQAKASVLPHDHMIQHNQIHGNMIGVELENVKGTQINENVLDNLLVNIDEK